jgi:hypothetical protein
LGSLGENPSTDDHRDTEHYEIPRPEASAQVTIRLLGSGNRRFDATAAK